MTKRQAATAWNTLPALPRLSASLAVTALWLETFRDKHGMRACSTRGIGPMRRKIGNPRAAAPPPDAGPEELVRDETQFFLAALCAMCPHKDCPMKDMTN